MSILITIYIVLLIILFFHRTLTHLLCLKLLEACGPTTRSMKQVLMEGHFLLPTFYGNLLVSITNLRCLTEFILVCYLVEVPYFPIPLAFGVNNERCGMSTKTGINARIVSGQRYDFVLCVRCSDVLRHLIA